MAKPKTHTARTRKAGRRSPLASVALILIGLVATGGAYALFTTSATADTTAASSQLVSQGSKLFAANCATCHGLNLEGAQLCRLNCAMCHNVAGAGGALTQGKFAPPLAGVSAKHAYEAMETGPQNMDVFNDKNITPTEKADIITYLKYLYKNPSPGGLDLGNLGPVSEGLFLWIFGLGSIVGVTIWLTAKAN